MHMSYKLPDGPDFTVSAKKKEVSKAMLGDYHQVYTITIKRGNVKKNFTFHDSVYNYRADKGATEPMLRDALYSILLDADCAEYCPTFRDFICEYNLGDEQQAEARRAFNQCHQTLMKISEMFSKSERKYIQDKFV